MRNYSCLSYKSDKFPDRFNHNLGRTHNPCEIELSAEHELFIIHSP